MDTTGRRQNPDEISTAALRYALGDHDGRNAQLDRIDAARNPDIPVPATPGDHVRITAGHLTGHTGTVRPWTEAPDSRDAYTPAVSPDSHAAVKLDGETVDTWAYIAHENLRRIESDLDEYECPESGCAFHILAAGPLTDDEPDHFAEDIEAHRASHLGDGRVHDAVEAERQAYDEGAARVEADDAPHAVDCIRCDDTGGVQDGPGSAWSLCPVCEPEGEPADIGEDDGQAPRPFQVGDEVLVDGEPGVIAEMRDGGASVYVLVEMTGFPFPAWDAVRLTPDRTRSMDSRRIELVHPARCTSRHAGIQCDLPVHEGLHAEGENGFVWDDAGHLVEHPHWDDQRHIWVDDAEAEQGTPAIGEWNTPAGDVIVFRRSDGVLCADVLADSSVKEPAHLRRLAEALNAAAVAWEAVL